MSGELKTSQDRSYIINLRDSMMRLRYKMDLEKDAERINNDIQDMMELLRMLSVDLGETAPQFEYPGILQDVADAIAPVKNYLNEAARKIKKADTVEGTLARLNDEKSAAIKERDSLLARQEQTIAILNKKLKDAEKRASLAPIPVMKKDPMKITIELNGLDDLDELRKFINAPAAKVHPVTLDDLDLPVRTMNCLRAERIETLAQLLKYTPNELLKIPNLGRRCLQQVQEELRKHGLELGR